MKLDLKTIEENKDLIPESVCACIEKLDPLKKTRVAKIDPAFADGASLSREYDIPYEQELNCLVIEGQRGEEKRYAAAIVPYGKRVNMNAKVRGPLDAKKISFADLDYVLEKTGMEYGSITPLGLPEDWLILIDESVFAEEEVVIGGGRVNAKLVLPSALLKELPNVQIIEGLVKE